MNEESIFAVALQKSSAADRQAYLDEACAGRPELRARVEELLSASNDAGSFLNHPPVGMDATIAETSAGDTAGDDAGPVSLAFLKPCDSPGRLGKLVGKAGEYEVIEVVGQGGMGAVLRALDTKLSRIVAVKIMAPELAANPQAVKRFLREATSAAAVHHDHVVTIHAIDDTHRPPFLVMQFIEGQTLQQKIDMQGALELKQILRIGSQTAAGLAAAHKQGLIHRDVKPGNILLENGVERVKITDFGLARAADDVDVTQTGMIAGTPQYMSPEQARGESIDARSDLFSLGSVLYTMCTGRPGFRAETTMGVLRRVCDDAPRPIHEVNAEIPPWLEAIVTKLLAKNPADRFQSASEVAEQLSQHLAHLQSPSQVARPATVMLPPPPATGHEPVRSTSGAATAIILTIAIVLLGLPVALLGLGVAAWFLYSSAGRPAGLPLDHYSGRQPADGGFTTLPVAQIESAGAIDSSWTQLFNGQDLSGWKTHADDPTDCWAVEEGAIVGRGGQSYLFTERGDFEDFHLRAEAQINATGDGGVVFRTDFAVRPPKSAGVAYTSGYEAQIGLRPNWPVHTGSLSGPADQSAGQAVFEVGPLNPHRPDEWFQLEVIARGPHIQVFVNGKPTADYRDETARYVRGHLALQTWAPDSTVIRFRKLEIKQLPPDATLVAALDPAKDKPISAECEDAGADGWLFTTADWKGFRLLELQRPPLENCRLIGRFEMKSEEATKAYPRLIARYPGDTAQDTIGKHSLAAEGDTHWTTYEVTLDLGPGERPEVVELGLHMEGRGTAEADKQQKNRVWIRSVELLTAPLPPADPAGGVKPEPDSAEVQALRDLVSAKERSRDDVKIRFNEGTVPPLALTAADTELLEARIRLAEVEGMPAAVVSLLKELVTKLVEQRGFLKDLVDGGAVVPAALTDADAKVADAKARLAEAEAAAGLK